MEFVQICFARLGGQGSGSGWQTLNVSPAISADVAKAFEQAEGGGMDARIASAIRGSGDAVMDVRVLGGFAFRSVTMFGMLDGLGRPSAFVQGIGCPVREFVDDPAIIVGLSDSNYCGGALADGTVADLTVDELEARTASLPQMIDREPPLSRTEALARVGLEQGSYASLLRCVYETLGFRAPQRRSKSASLTVVCDCAPETIRAVMTAVYLGLPKGVRARVSYSDATAQRADAPTVRFATSAGAGEKSFDLATGRQNALKRAQEQQWEAMPFATLATTSGDISQEALDEQFERLEQRVSSFADMEEARAPHYELAFDDLWPVSGDKLPSTEEIERKLLTILDMPRPKVASRRLELDRMLNNVLGEVMDAGIELGDMTEEGVLARVGDTESDELKETGSAYVQYALLKLPAGKAAARLAQMRAESLARSDGSFTALCKQLSSKPEGRELLELFYKKVLYGEFDGLAGNLTPQAIADYWNEGGRCGLDLGGQVDSLAEAYLLRHIGSPRDPWTAEDEMGRAEAFGDAVAALASALPDLSPAPVERARSRFWGLLPAGSFPLVGCAMPWADYERAVGGTPSASCSALEAAADLIAALQGGMGRLMGKRTQKLRACIERLGEGGASDDLRENIKRSLLEIRRGWGPVSAADDDFLPYDDWFDIASLVVGDAEALSFMLELGVVPRDSTSFDAFASTSKHLSAEGDGVDRLLDMLDALARRGGADGRLADAVLQGVAYPGDAANADFGPARAERMTGRHAREDADPFGYAPQDDWWNGESGAVPSDDGELPAPPVSTDYQAVYGTGAREERAPKKRGGFLGGLFGRSKKGRN